MLGQSAETDKDTGYVVYTENDFDTAADFLYFRAGKEIGTYTIEFTPSLKSSIANNPVLNDFKNVLGTGSDKIYQMQRLMLGNPLTTKKNLQNLLKYSKRIAEEEWRKLKYEV